MPDTDGITLLKEWASTGLLTMPVVMMSGHGTIDTAVEATRIGAYDFLEKPIALQKLLATVGRALSHGEQPPQTTLSLASMGRASAGRRPQAAAGACRQPQDATADHVRTRLRGGVCARFLHPRNAPWVAPEATAVLAEAPLDLLQTGARRHVVCARRHRTQQDGTKRPAVVCSASSTDITCASFAAHHAPCRISSPKASSTNVFTPRCR